ncbi:NADH:flavin oxidoreductase/NADH oxidase [Deinococcus yavapaiensis]|uniref:2,4-dienoyl-CoA reductase-like NADH-dependent reductase (Old Yellow Enzyme family) n=1 Tax=Deinococcus yavapaiensis KR-236 TaxID=694435 RepID=A0A318SA02_9DEIO|nr:NADH:flavin oxidoreductase/NADH oxidase [Deinococcus yavapaiensis]PYE55208.1 2,4-dienoyl-CoA reductase-like NADH-dependent reductase (Old Yellow Enzyme family) [Deinococcus yavapaiensis KR-236]
MSQLFSPLALRSLTLQNRLVVSPMCMYSSRDGFANNFHLVHLGQFALGRAGLIFTEATAVNPEGRISPDDLGLWKDEHVTNIAEICDFVHQFDGLIGVQLAHAGRKASTASPFKGRGGVPDEAGGWQPLGPSDEPYHGTYRTPCAMTRNDISDVIDDFRAATKRAILAGFDVVEVHAAHGYLLHEFLSPLSNTREDEYGGSFENRTRLLLEVTRAVRSAWPDHLPLFVRLSASDWVEGGWDVEETVAVSQLLRDEGVDVVDVSSGGLSPLQNIHVAAGYQVPFAARVKAEANVATMAVGLLTDPAQCEEVLTSGAADLVAVAREFLRDPHFPLRAARMLGDDLSWPLQYDRAK